MNDSTRSQEARRLARYLAMEPQGGVALSLLDIALDAERQLFVDQAKARVDSLPRWENHVDLAEVRALLDELGEQRP